MSPTVLYAVSFPPFRDTAPPYTVPRVDGITEGALRRIVREEIERLDKQDERIGQLERLIVALEAVVELCSLGDGDERKRIVLKHITELHEALRQLKEE